MTVTQAIIPVGVGVRTGKPLKECLGLVIHWIGCCQPRAEKVLESFKSTNLGTQYICDWNDGHILQVAPEDERCNHVGSVNGYTEMVRKLIGKGNPNDYFVGIECCIGDKVIPADWYERGKHMELGKPSDKQYAALVEFAADFLTRHGMTTDNLYRHYDITGKLCHVWFVKDEARWTKFKADVAEKMKGEEEMTKEETKALFHEMLTQELAERDAVVAEAAQRVSPWAKEAWDEAVAEGALDGTRPGGNLTREQYAVIRHREKKG